MKKIIFIFTLIICLTAVPLFSYAGYDNANNNIIDGMQSVDKDLAEDKEKIIERALNDIRAHYNDNNIDESIINFNDAMKGNYYMPFVEANELTLEDVQNFVDNENTSYYILLNNEQKNDYGSIDLIKTDINGEMHWTVSSVNFDNYKADYINASYNLLNEYNVKNSYVYFIVGFGDYPKRALVIFRENSNNAEFIVIDDFKVNSENEVEFLPNTELGKRTYTYRSEERRVGKECL